MRFDKMIEKGSQQANVMRENSGSPAKIIPRAATLTASFPISFAVSLAALLAVLQLAGCGNFWQAPGSTGSSTGTTASTTTLTTSPSGSTTTGTQVTLTATVSPSAATGTVNFYNNSVFLSSGTLSSGVATNTASFSTAGTESLTATYEGSSVYEQSTSSAVSLTVSTASSSAHTQPIASVSAVTGIAYGASPLHAISAFSASGGTYTAKNAQAAVVESGGSITLTGATLSGAAGSGSGVLLSNRTVNQTMTAQLDSPYPARFTMNGGSLTYNCGSSQTGICNQSSATRTEGAPATLFSVLGTKAAVTLTDVKVTNNTTTSANGQGILLTVSKSSAAGSNGGNAAFTAQGVTLSGDVLVDSASAAQLQLLKDAAGAGSSLTGAINPANAGKAVGLTLDESSIWTVTATSYVTSLQGLDIGNSTVNNIDGGGHCVYYSGSIDVSGAQIYALSGGGFLAPAGTTGLACH